jgi:hypothetical protein
LGLATSNAGWHQFALGGTDLDLPPSASSPWIGMTGGTDSDASSTDGWHRFRRVRPAWTGEWHRFRRTGGTSSTFARGPLTRGTSLDSARVRLTGGTDSIVWRRKTNPRPGLNRLLRTRGWYQFNRRPGWNDGWHQLDAVDGMVTQVHLWYQFTPPFTSRDASIGRPQFWCYVRVQLTGGTDSIASSTDGSHRFDDGWHRFDRFD